MHKSIENTSSGVSTSSSITSMTTQVSCKDSLLLETTNTNNSAYNIEDFNNKNKVSFFKFYYEKINFPSQINNLSI